MIIQIGTVNFWPATAMSLTTLTFAVYKSIIESALLSLVKDGYDFSPIEKSSSTVLYQIRYEDQSAGSIIFAQEENLYSFKSDGLPHQVETEVSIELGKAIERYLDKNNPELLDRLEKKVKPEVGDEVMIGSRTTEWGLTLSFDSFSVGGRAVKGSSPRPAGGNGAGMAGDDKLKAEIERLFPNPKTLDKTRSKLFVLAKLKGTSPNLTKEQLAGQLTIGVETVKDLLKMLRENKLI